MAFVLLIVVALIAVVITGVVLFAMRSSGTKEHPLATGEPRASQQSPSTSTTAAPTPTVEELEAMLEAPPAPEPPIAKAPPAPPHVAPPTEVAAPVEAPEPEVVEKPRLRDRLGRTRSALAGAFRGLRGHQVDDDTWDELEEALLLADVGIPTTTRLLDAVRTRAKADAVSEPDGVVGLLRDEVTALLDGDADRELRVDAGSTNVWMFVGVNGVGKTTTIGKLASQQTGEGHRVVLAAADTFRAAAADQLQLWAERTGGEIIRGQEGADPGSIVFDAMAAASSRGADLVLVDTAGRLHTKVNLMEELKKLRRIVDRTEGALKEVLLVIDASTGQNGLVQAKQFAEAVDVSGIVLTKLDGTAKGGIVLAIQSELGIPVKAVGVGEGIADLIEFDPDEFASALFEPATD
jgi:fused signal recognition particle receptor